MRGFNDSQGIDGLPSAGATSIPRTIPDSCGGVDVKEFSHSRVCGELAVWGTAPSVVRLPRLASFVVGCLTSVDPVVSNPKTFLFAPLLRTKEKLLCELRLWGWESWVKQWQPT